tara:strand:- start:3723 stop:4343 length:621 start_codon:yes stop_codon:yes gene_type:complete
MLQQLEQVLEQRTTVKYFDGNPIPNHITEVLKKSVVQTPSCNNRYNYKVKVIGQSLEDRKAKVNLHNYICTVSNKPVENINNANIERPPKSLDEAYKWKEQGILFPNINGQVLAPLLFIWYIPDSDPINTDWIDIGLSCWNSVLKAEMAGIQTGFCTCFDSKCLQDFLKIPGLPVVILGFGYASSTIPNHEKHKDRSKPLWDTVVS